MDQPINIVAFEAAQVQEMGLGSSPKDLEQSFEVIGGMDPW
jgi:hypothetical protein